MPRKPKPTPIHTAIGVLFGRDAIHLDKVVQDGSDLSFEGEICGALCGDPSKHELWIAYRIDFSGVQAYECIELDARYWESSSSFDEVTDSAWLAKLKLASLRHFELWTYDYIYRIAAETFVLTLGAEHP